MLSKVCLALVSCVVEHILKLEAVNIVDLFMTMFVTAMFRFRVFYTWPFFLVLFFQCRMPIDEMDGCPG